MIVMRSVLGKISIISVVGLVIGAVGGYIYYAQVGCVSGTCGITSNPWMSTAWGAAFGYLVFDMVPKNKKGLKKDGTESKAE
jgi:xanthine/uracil permease